MTTTSTVSTPSGFADAFVDAVGDTGPDYRRLAEIATEIVPFGSHAGVEVTEIGPEGAVVEIPDRDYLRNHLATVHAGALFLAADIAGAAAFVGAVAPRLRSIDLFMLRDARSVYRKPARGRIRALATVDQSDIDRVLSAPDGGRFDVDGRARLVDDDDVLVAKFTFDYSCTLIAGAPE